MNAGLEELIEEGQDHLCGFFGIRDRVISCCCFCLGHTHLRDREVSMTLLITHHQC